jgi:hypothetical protein
MSLDSMLLSLQAPCFLPGKFTAVNALAGPLILVELPVGTPTGRQDRLNDEKSHNSY